MTTMTDAAKASSGPLIDFLGRCWMLDAPVTAVTFNTSSGTAAFTLAATGMALVRDTLFRFELNLRESLVLGLVGAGGIGFYIQLYVRSFQYEKVATLTLVVLAMVLAIEQINTLLRSLLR